MQPVLKLRDLKTYFYTHRGVAKAVDGVSLHVDRGETLCIVGESGCGKSITAMSILRLIQEPPGRIVGGECIFDGIDLFKQSRRRMRAIRGRRIAMIFQEPMTSLSPVYTIGDQIGEVFRLHRGVGRRESFKRAVEMLELVQIPDSAACAQRYPHQLSGGMRQRVMIAMAMACDPELLIADEPTTALDVTVQAEILDLMRKMKEEFGTALILITHDMGVVSQMAQRVAVMYAGRVVEEGSVDDIFRQPKHPYTQGLLESVPKLGRRSESGPSKLREIAGTVPSPFQMPPGCAFRSRCPKAMAICAEQDPQAIEVGKAHATRCWLHA